MKKDFLTLLDRKQHQLLDIISNGIKLKKDRQKGRSKDIFKGRAVAMIFEKSSTRTRISFEVGVNELGGKPLFLSSTEIQLGRGESIEDTAKVLERYVSLIMIRTFEHAKVQALAENSSIPVVNGLTDEFHPCQILADIMTIKEKLGRIEGVKVAYIGDGNNIANSWLNGASMLGMHLSIASPKGYSVDTKIHHKALQIAKESKAIIHLTNDPFEAVKDADVIYTDVWASMGQESEHKKRLKDFKGYEVNKKLFTSTGRDTLFMHCLPAHRGEEVSADIIDSKSSVIFDEAENRLHIQKAIMVDCMENFNKLIKRG